MGVTERIKRSAVDSRQFKVERGKSRSLTSFGMTNGRKRAERGDAECAEGGESGEG
jgi:hypothetical protein